MRVHACVFRVYLSMLGIMRCKRFFEGAHRSQRTQASGLQWTSAEGLPGTHTSCVCARAHICENVRAVRAGIPRPTAPAGRARLRAGARRRARPATSAGAVLGVRARVHRAAPRRTAPHRAAGVPQACRRPGPTHLHGQGTSASRHTSRWSSAQPSSPSPNTPQNAHWSRAISPARSAAAASQAPLEVSSRSWTSGLTHEP